MIRVTALDHIVLNVADVERSLAFYQGCLGLQPERLDAWRKGEVRFPSVRIDESTIVDLFKSDEPSAAQRTNLAHFCLVTDAADMAAVVEELGRAGVEVERGPIDAWGARGQACSIYFRDPDGNQIELRSYAAS